MLREKLYRTYCFIIIILKCCMIFFLMICNGRHKTFGPGFKFSIVSILSYLTYDYLCKLFSHQETDEGNAYKENVFKSSETTKNCVDKEQIRPFQIHVPPEVLTDFHCRLQGTRFEEPLYDSGTDSHYLRTLIEYWKTNYKWRKYEQELNNNPNFKTSVEGVDIHFIHIKATINNRENLQVIPILLIHGWPGNCYDYRKYIPLLSNSLPGYKHVFDVVCPSIPGFGFSESPKCIGFNVETAARMFVSLMDRLGYPRFYVQGCGWGTVTASLVARYYPTKVMGLHVNMCFSLVTTFDYIVKLLLMAVFPFLTSSTEYKMIFPFRKKFGMLLNESGFFLLQSTKPDIIGFSESDSPAAMLAFVLDKYSLEANQHLDVSDERITNKYMVDEILTTATLMWVNNNFAASSMFYKETITDIFGRVHEKVSLTVPSAVAAFPDEPLMLPKLLMADLFADLVSYNLMPTGGRFCAAEEPQLLAEDIRKFVEIVESRPY